MIRNLLSRAAFLLLPACFLPMETFAAASPAPEIRFCPAAEVRTYPADSARDVTSLLLHNVLILNRGNAILDISGVEIELLQAGGSMDRRVFDRAAVKAIAEAGVRVQEAGALQLFAFQFCGGELIPDGTTISGPALNPGQALLVMQQPFVYQGKRDAVRVTVRGRIAGRKFESSAKLPVRSTYSQTSFRFPLKGTWLVANGPTFHTEHRWALPEEFGMDVVRLGPDSSSHRGDGSRFEDYYAYANPVFAAAGGRVIGVASDVAEDPASLRAAGEGAEEYSQRVEKMQAARLSKGNMALVGNYLLVDQGHSEYALYAHLKPGSVGARVGDVVEAGQLIGAVGSSGNSAEPHLHFQVCDRPDVLLCAGIPVQFEGIQLPLADSPRALQSGDIVIAQ